MKVSFSDITERGIRRSISGNGWSAESGLEFVDPPEAEITLTLIDEITVDMKGGVRATVDSLCSRCGTSVPFRIDQAFHYTFRLEEDTALSQKEVECGEEDWETVYIEEPVIDVKEVLVEQLILSLPEKLLCDEQCKGLCPRCGASLNDGKCRCADDQPDSPFAILKHLKK